MKESASGPLFLSYEVHYICVCTQAKGYFCEYTSIQTASQLIHYKPQKCSFHGVKRPVSSAGRKRSTSECCIQKCLCASSSTPTNTPKQMTKQTHTRQKLLQAELRKVGRRECCTNKLGNIQCHTNISTLKKVIPVRSGCLLALLLFVHEQIRNIKQNFKAIMVKANGNRKLVESF